MQDYRKLEVWQRAHELTLSVYRSTQLFPKSEQYGLSSQIRRAAVSISANIAEGCGRGGNPELARFIQISLGSASELECELLLARDLNYLDSATHERLSSEVEQIKRMLSALMKRVRETS